MEILFCYAFFALMIWPLTKALIEAFAMFDR
jgi:hypothetical protein